MISFIGISKAEPYKEFINLYKQAALKGQRPIEAVSVSSYNKMMNEVESRFVNLKYISNEEWIFFTNYNSKKAIDFSQHDQISALLYWNSINVQIRIKAKIVKTSEEFSDQHFNSRSKKKNALAISSKQSDPIKTYEEVVINYENILNSENNTLERPSYWGGYSFFPYYFEFWEGHGSRLNKRKVYEYQNNKWKYSILQP